MNIMDEIYFPKYSSGEMTRIREMIREIEEPVLKRKKSYEKALKGNKRAIEQLKRMGVKLWIRDGRRII